MKSLLYIFNFLSTYVITEIDLVWEIESEDSVRITHIYRNSLKIENTIIGLDI